MAALQEIARALRLEPSPSTARFAASSSPAGYNTSRSMYPVRTAGNGAAAEVLDA
jgi:hypothetical protein